MCVLEGCGIYPVVILKFPGPVVCCSLILENSLGCPVLPPHLHTLFSLCVSVWWISTCLSPSSFILSSAVFSLLLILSKEFFISDTTFLIFHISVCSCMLSTFSTSSFNIWIIVILMSLFDGSNICVTSHSGFLECFISWKWVGVCSCFFVFPIMFNQIPDVMCRRTVETGGNSVYLQKWTCFFCTHAIHVEGGSCINPVSSWAGFRFCCHHPRLQSPTDFTLLQEGAAVTWCCVLRLRCWRVFLMFLLIFGDLFVLAPSPSQG